jgi:uncharacterized protein YggE
MRLVISLLLGVVLGASAGTALAADTSPSTEPEVCTTGEGSVHATPDVARMKIGVEIFNTDLSDADSEADRRMSAVVRTLRSAGVPESHIRTAGLVIQPQYDTREGQPQAMRGYIVQNMLEVESSDVPGLAALIDNTMAAGANRIETIRFEPRNLNDLQSQARDRAWSSARQKAEQLALKAGLRLVRVTQVEEPLLEAVSTVRADPSMGTSNVIANSPAPLQSGEIEVRAQVKVTWAAAP